MDNTAVEKTAEDKNVWQTLSKGQQITAAGGATALIAGFLPWYVMKDQFIDSVSFKGTEFTFGWMGLVLLLAATALTIAPAFDKQIGNDQISGEQIAVIAAGLGSLLWLIRFVRVPAVFFNVMGRGFGLFVAAAAAAAVVTGVVMTMKEKGIAMPTVDNVKSMKTGVATTVTTPASAVPTQNYAAPQAAPAPQNYAAPQAAPQAAPAPQTYAAPQAVPAPQAAPAPQNYAAPTDQSSVF